jgi:S1-C subfamily serine protease
VRRAYLGLSSLPIDLPARLAGPGTDRVALLLTAVEDGSPAARAGLLVGDLLLALGDSSLASVGDLMSCLDAERIGQVLRARIVRGGVAQEIAVELGARGS